MSNKVNLTEFYSILNTPEENIKKNFDKKSQEKLIFIAERVNTITNYIINEKASITKTDFEKFFKKIVLLDELYALRYEENSNPIHKSVEQLSTIIDKIKKDRALKTINKIYQLPNADIKKFKNASPEKKNLIAKAICDSVAFMINNNFSTRKMEMFLEKIAVFDKFLKSENQESLIFGSIKNLRQTIEQQKLNSTQSIEGGSVKKSQDSRENRSQEHLNVEKPMRRVVLQAVPLETRFRTQLANLDLDSPTFSTQIKELIGLLRNLHSSRKIEESDYLRLSQALQSLNKSQGYYKPSNTEIQTWKVVGKHSSSFKEALNRTNSSTEVTERNGRVLMLKHLKKHSDLELSALSRSISKTTKEIEKSLIRERLMIIISKTNKQDLFGENFINNFFILKSALESFHSSFFNKWGLFWEEVPKKVLDRETKGEGSRVLETYPYMHPMHHNQWLFQKVLKKYTENLTLGHLVFNSPDAFKRTIANFNARADTRMNSFCQSLYKVYFLQKHSWFSKNFSALKQAYNQAEHGDVNQGGGTCLENSLDRHALLMSNPSMGGKDIPMGSTLLGRFQRAQIRQRTRQEVSFESLSNKQAFKEIRSIENRSVEVRGLKEVVEKQKTYRRIESLMKAIDHSNGNFFCTLSLYLTEGAHAINLQVDQELGIFRIIDDNLGVLQWDSYEEFRLELASYLSIFYSVVRITTNFHEAD